MRRIFGAPRVIWSLTKRGSAQAHHLRCGRSEENRMKAVNMKRLVNLILLFCLVPAGAMFALRQARELDDSPERQSNKMAAVNRSIPYRDLAVPVEGGNFVLKNLSLIRMEGSTKLAGDLLNNTGERWNKATFEVKAYDRDGRQLKGAEDLIIFEFHGLERDASVALDSGYGVWLEGVAIDSIARLEVILIDGELPASYRFAMKRPVSGDSLAFEDSDVRISFDITSTQIGLVFANKTGKPITVDWERAAYVDTSGKSHQVIPARASYSHGKQPSLPAVVSPAAEMRYNLLPTDYVHYSRLTNRWISSSLLPEGPEAESSEGKSISVLMPLKIAGVSRDYHFAFKIAGVEIRRVTQDSGRRRLLFDSAKAQEDFSEVEE